MLYVRGIVLASFLGLSLCASRPAWGAEESPRTYTVQGRFTDAAGTSPLLDTISLTLGVYDPSGTCLLYEETQAGIDLTATNGIFSVQLGSISTDNTKRTANDPGHSMATIFSNKGSQIEPNGPNCAGGYTPASGDARSLRISYTPSVGAPVTLSPDQTLNATPQASVAETLQGLGLNEFLQVTGAATSLSVSKANVDTLFGLAGVVDASALHHHDGAYCKLSGTAAQNLGSGGIYGTGAIGTGVAIAPSGIQLQVKASADNVLGAVIQANSATQSADLIQVRNSAGSPVFKVAPSGDLTIANATAATAGANSTSSELKLSGQYWNGAASATDTWTLQNVLGAGTNPTSTLTMTHSGSSGNANVAISSGNLGIGTTTPGFPLDVKGTGATGATTSFNLQDSTGTSTFSVDDAGGVRLKRNALIASDTSVSIDIDNNNDDPGRTFVISHNNGTELMRVQEDGNVGIGTTAPVGVLDVMSASTQSESIIGRNTTQSTIMVSALNLFNKSSNSTSNGFGTEINFAMQDTTGVWGDLGRIGGVRAGADNTGDLLFRTSTANVLNERMRILSSGNVGIGIAAPTARLHVDTTSGVLFKLTSNGAGRVEIDDSPGNTLMHLRSGAQNSIVKLDTNGVSYFNGGHVGIGTTAPLFDIVTNSETRVLGITGDGSASAASTGAIYLMNNRATTTVGDYAGSIVFGSVNNSGSNKVTAYISDQITGAGGANGFGSSLIFATKGDNVAGLPSNYVVMDSSGNFGIGDLAPDTKLKVVGSICAKSDANDCAGNVAGTIYANNVTVQSADYAEYFLAEEDLLPGDIVGINPRSGLTRGYRAGDRLLGIVSTSPGVVGNTEIQDRRTILVALMGQVPFNRSLVRINQGKVLTQDGQTIGYLLADGNVYVNVGSANFAEEIDSLRKDNQAKNRKIEALEERLARIEKVLQGR